MHITNKSETTQAALAAVMQHGREAVNKVPVPQGVLEARWRAMLTRINLLNTMILMNIENFLNESNQIEGIPDGCVHPQHIDAAKDFLALEKLEVCDVVNLANIFAGGRLRDQVGLNVTIGQCRPPCGSPHIREFLETVLDYVNAGNSPEYAYRAHFMFEWLHPFTDGNGRVGRLIWLRMMDSIPEKGFLHEWYYQSLRYGSFYP